MIFEVESGGMGRTKNWLFSSESDPRPSDDERSTTQLDKQTRHWTLQFGKRNRLTQSMTISITYF